MKIENKVVKNASWILVCRIAQAVLTLIISMLSTRYLGPSLYGLIHYATSLVTFILPIMQLGLNNILVHETICNPDEEGKILGTSLVLSFISSIACIVGIFVFVFFANAGQTETIIVAMLYSTVLLFRVFEHLQYWFQAKYLSKYVAVATLIGYAVTFIYKIILLIAKMNVRWFAVATSLDYFIIAIALLVIYKKLGGQKILFSHSVAKRLLSASKHYILANMMISVFLETDKIMIKLILDETQTGYYSAAVTCTTITSFVFTAIIDSAIPLILENRKTDIAIFEKNMSNLYCIITYISLAQSIVITIAAELVIYIFCGEEFLPASNALRIIIWYCTFSYFGGVRNIWILAEKKQKYLWMVNLSGACANIVLNIVLIHFLGIEGAALASLITQFFANVVMGFFIKPLRRSNVLMLKGLNPKLLGNMIRSLK